MRGTRRGKVRWVLVAAMVPAGCADRPAISPRDSLVDPIRVGIVVDLAVFGGPHAGRYHVETLQGSCSRRSFGRGSWVIRYAKQGAKPSSLELRIPHAASAEQGTGQFALAVAFGAEARRFGSGTALVRDHGGRATVRVNARTGDGVRLEATIRCNDVLRVPGLDGG